LKDKKILCVIIFFCFLAVLTSVSISDAGKMPAPPEEDMLLFSRPLSGVSLVKGGREKRIIYRHGAHIAPRLSPDGEKILFHSKQDGPIAIWLANLNGQEMQRLCDGDQANWSPDGRRIVFRREGRIMEKEVSSGAERVISAENMPSCEFPSYLPDGRAMFVSDDRIFLSDSENLEQLAERDIRSAPRCSPDGKKIAYQGGAHIYVMDMESRKSTQLTTDGGVQSWPVWSSDGQSICYCQSPEAFGGPWDLCRVAINSPENFRVLERDVEVSFDWRGSPQDKSTRQKIPTGHNIDLRQVEDEITVENDWGVISLSLKGSSIHVLPRKKRFSEQSEMEIYAKNREGNFATGIESVDVLNNDGESVVLSVSFRSADGGAMSGIFSIPRSRPFIGIKPVESLDSVYIKKVMDLALLPDRFGDDLILDPDKYPNLRISLPHAPFLMGLAHDRAMLLAIAPGEKQEIRLMRGENKRDFVGVEIQTEGEEIFISLLAVSDLWYKTMVFPDLQNDSWKIRWSSPFSAQWRAAVAGDGRYYSRMWGEDALSDIRTNYLPLEGEFPRAPELSVVYAYGRSWNTPLEILTPGDILQDTLGIDRLKDVLDIEGLRAYRTAEQPVPLHVFLTSQDQRLWPENSPGWPESLDFSPIYQLLVRIRMFERKGVEETAAHLLKDILNSLRGLDNRIKEYERFLASMESFCETNGEQTQEIVKDIKELEKRIADLPISDLDILSESIEAFKKSSGTGEELWDSSEFDRFREISGTALSERKAILAEYRDFVKKVRNDAGIAITKKPESKDISEELRRLTQNILRNRYYLEGDWRGENPLK